MVEEPAVLVVDDDEHRLSPSGLLLNAV